MASQADVRRVDNALDQQTTSKTNKFAPNADFGDGKSSKYKIDQRCYPVDLMSPDGKYGGNYVIFFINVPSDSKLLKGPNAETVEDYTPGERGFTVGANYSKEQLFAGQAGLAVGGAALGKALGVGGGSAAAAGMAVVGTGVTLKQAASASRAQKRMKTAIALHVPNQLSIRYGVQWSEEDTFALSAAATAGKEVAKALQTKGKNSNVTGVAADVITNLSLSKGPNAGAMSAATGLASNPKRDQVFKGVDFRTFQFEYQFFPRNEPEAKNVLDIIYDFKLHMHPEYKDSNSFLYVYPSEFDIIYYTGGEENSNINRHTSCVLTEMNVNYTPNGNFATFPNGMPTQINVTLSFRELALMSKELISKGM